MFERFDDDARAVVVNSQAHARRMGHTYMGCEHLLLAVASLDDDVGEIVRSAGATPLAIEGAIRRLLGGNLLEGIDGEALAAIGVDLDLVREKIEAQFGPKSEPLRRGRRWGRRRTCAAGPGHIPFTPRAKKCLELSLREALAMNDGHIGAEHIVLALVRMREGVTPEIFDALGISADALRTSIRDRHRQAG